MEEIDHERADARAGNHRAHDSCLARLFARLHHRHHPQQPSSDDLSARERNIVQEAARAAAQAVMREAVGLSARERNIVQEAAHAATQAVMREAVSTAIRTVAPDVAPERAPHVAQERARAMARAVLPPSVAGLFQDFMNPEPPPKSR